MSSNSNIQDIIIRHLNDEASGEDAEMLQQWLNADPAHVKEYDTLARLWNDSAGAALRQYDTNMAWQTISARISAPRETRVIQMFPWQRSAVAAIFILFVAGAFYFYINTSKMAWKEVAAMDNHKVLKLADGSQITLRKGSKLRIPDKFGKDFRHIELSGEAYFEVTHDENNPFNLTTAKSSIQDLGTAFLVITNDSVEQVVVTEGKVSFSRKNDRKKALVLRAGEAAVLKALSPERQFRETANILSWKTKVIEFNNTPLRQVATDLKDYFNVNVLLSPELNADEILITAEFRGEPLEKVIEELQLLSGLTFRKETNTVYVSK